MKKKKKKTSEEGKMSTPEVKKIYKKNRKRSKYKISKPRGQLQSETQCGRNEPQMHAEESIPFPKRSYQDTF